jgi:SAM-dependent methyltransferase
MTIVSSSEDSAERFRALVRRPEVFHFAKRIIIESYVDCAPQHASAMRLMLEEAFARLEGGSQHKGRFKHSLSAIYEQVFRKEDADFWFNQVYRDYKRNYKPGRRFAELQPLLLGRRILDLGCGNGLTSLVLEQHGYQVFLTDVLDYRDMRARHLAFQPMTDAGTIPFSGERFDSALVIAVLHHVREENILAILRNLHATSRRVIIEEDTYQVPEHLPGLENVLAEDSQLQSFMRLNPNDQLGFLMFMDYFANALTQGISAMHIPFNFKTVTEWQHIFAENGFSVQKTIVKGFQAGLFNRSCHVWFVLDAETDFESGLNGLDSVLLKN